MRVFAGLLTGTVAAVLLASGAVASQHGNELVHSREYRGQVYVMYKTHMSLYTYAKDSKGVSNCTGGCAEIWPPARLEKGAKLGKNYSLIKRADGTWQAAFRGMPLYLYKGDKNIGDTNGDGIAGVWKLARP